MSTSTAPIAPPERWTIVTDDGRAMFREDIFTEAEAREYVADEPRTRAGSLQVPVPESVARAAGRRWKAIYERREAQAHAEGRLMLLGLLDEAGCAPREAALLSASAARARRAAAELGGVEYVA